MLIFILNDVQFSQKAVRKGSHCQNHSSSGSLLPAKKFIPVKFLISSSHFTSPSLTAILKNTHTFPPLKETQLLWGGGDEVIIIDGGKKGLKDTYLTLGLILRRLC